MGGKTKQSQRTKNNVRPSSSGRSALLLDNVQLGTNVMNIAGTELPALFPSLAAPNLDPLISPELQMCIKKLNKKDPITKTKALQELWELVSVSNVEDVVALLASWAHFYRLLSLDPDRKVRELTQLCHARLVSVCGRQVAPHLRALVPWWLLATYDSHAPASTHASASLEKTFPGDKLPEVISFCKNEIMTHIVDNLTGAGEAALAKKSDTAEEKEAQVSRLVSHSLHLLGSCCVRLPRSMDAWLWTRLEPLLRNNMFWKRATHTDTLIRVAWYSAVGRLVERFRDQFPEQFGQKALRVLVGAKEHSPLAAAQLWDALLLFMHNVEDWHKYLDKAELLSKRILDILEKGGWGDARHLTNILLPILAHLPPDMLTKQFYITFFDAIFNGLDKKTVLSSKSERQAWITSLDECLRYVSIQSQEFIPELVTSVHRTWLQRILADTLDGQVRTNLIKHSACTMATLLKYWLNKAKEAHNEKYDQLIRNFWQNVGSTIATQIDKCSADYADIAKLIDGHILLLQTLKTSFVQDNKKQHSIKFDGDEPTVLQKPKEPTQCDASVVERYYHNLNVSVEKVCVHYLEFAFRKQVSSPVLSPLITLLVDFDSRELFVGIARQLECECPYEWYDRVLRGWLAGDTMRCKALVDIVFLMKKHLSDSEQDALFDSFKQFPPSVVEWCISLSLSHPHCLSAPVRRWLAGPLVETTLSTICQRVIQTGDSKARDLLLLCLNHDASGVMIISPSAVSKILEQISEGISCIDSPALEHVACLGARLCSTVAPSPQLVLALFQLSVRVPRGSGLVSLDTWCELVSAWQDGLAALGGQGEGQGGARAEVLRGAARLVHAHTQRSRLFDVVSTETETSDDTQKNDLSVELRGIEHAISLCPYLLSSNSQQDISEIVHFTRTVFDIPPMDASTVETFVLRHMICTGAINCPFEGDDVTTFITRDYTKQIIEELSRDNLLAYMRNCSFKAVYLRSVLLHKLDEDLEDTWCNDLLVDDYMTREYCEVIHDHWVIDYLYNKYAFWRHYMVIKETKERLHTLINDIIVECTLNTNKHVLNVLSEIAAVKGHLWSFAYRWFEAQAKSNPICQTIGDNTVEKTEIILENINSTTERVDVQENIKNKEENLVSSEIKNEGSQEKNGQSDVEDKKLGISEEPLDLEHIMTGSGYFHSLQGDASSNELRTSYLVMVRSVYAAHGDLLGEAFLRDVRAPHASCDPDVIINAYYKHNHVMLYEEDISESPWSVVVSNAAIARYLSALVTSRGWELQSHQWDFVNISACNLLTAVLHSKHNLYSTKVSMLSSAVVRLVLCVQRFVSCVQHECERRQPSAHVAHLPTEWADIFAPDIHGNLLDLCLYVLERSSEPEVSANHIAVLEALTEYPRCVQWGAVRGARKDAGAGARAGARVLASTAHYAYKYLAYQLLLALMEPLVLEDASALSAWTAAGEDSAAEGEERPLPPLSLRHYDDAYSTLQDLVGTAVSHVKVCVSTCSLEPWSDVHRLALGWCLLADVLARHCQLARGDLHHHYIHTYRARKYLEPLLTTVLRLLPEEVVRLADGGAALPATYAHMFTDMVPLTVYEYCSARSVSSAACRALYWCCPGAGAGDARGWRGAAPHRHARLLDCIVETYISPQVAKRELTLVHQRAAEIEDTDVTILWSTYEVIAVLTVDDRPIELKVTLSRSHPLGLPQIVAPENAPVRNTHWLVMYIGYQGGTVLNALKMWCGAVTSRVERATQCYICYCRLHHVTGRLPASYCRRCKNKFHLPCLRKWFVTSTKSTCPMCRSAF